MVVSVGVAELGAECQILGWSDLLRRRSLWQRGRGVNAAIFYETGVDKVAW